MQVWMSPNSTHAEPHRCVKHSILTDDVQYAYVLCIASRQSLLSCWEIVEQVLDEHRSTLPCGTQLTVH